MTGRRLSLTEALDLIAKRNAARTAAGSKYEPHQGAREKARRVRQQQRQSQKETPMIAKMFAYHKPSETGLVQVTALREQFSALALSIETMCPPSRERAVAITQLETAAMWAVKAIVCNDPDSEADTRE